MLRLLPPLLLIAACAPRTAPPPQVVVMPPAPAPESEEQSALASVLVGVGYTIGLPIELQQRQLSRWSEAFANDRQGTDRLRVAMLLTLGDRDLQDPERAAALLREAAWTADQGAYQTLGRLLLEIAAVREHATARVDELHGKLDAERARRVAIEAEVEELRELEQKLQQLKALEADLSSDAPPPTPSPAVADQGEGEGAQL